MKAHAFTVLELLVTLTVAAALSGVMFPIIRSALSKTDSAECIGNLRQIGTGLNLWLAEHEMLMPPLAAGRKCRTENVPVIDTVLLPYVSDSRIFICPADSDVGFETGTSYFWYSVLSNQSAFNLNFLSISEDPSRIPLLVDKEGWHDYSEDKVNHLFADGHVANQLRLFSDP